MSWLIFAFFTIFFYTGFDFFLKMASGKIHDGLGGFIINLVAMFVLLVFVIYSKLKGEQLIQTKTNGVLFSVIAGLFIGIATITFIKMFAAGVNLSLGIPLVRIGIVLLASLLGILVLKEPISLRYIFGFLLALGGLYLLVTK